MGDGRVPRRTQSRRRGRSSDETRSGEWDEYQVQRGASRRHVPRAESTPRRRRHPLDGFANPLEGVAFFTPLPLRLAAVATSSYDRPPSRSPPPFFPVLNPGFRFTNTSSAPLRDGSRSESRRRFASPSARAFFFFPVVARLGAGASSSPFHPPPTISKNQRLRTRASPTRRRASSPSRSLSRSPPPLSPSS